MTDPRVCTAVISACCKHGGQYYSCYYCKEKEEAFIGEEAEEGLGLGEKGVPL